MVKLKGLPRKRLTSMAAAGERILECYRVLQKSDTNVVAEVLRGQVTFYDYDHYPAGDVHDPGFIDQLRVLRSDLFLSAAYPQIFKPALLEGPTVSRVERKTS